MNCANSNKLQDNDITRATPPLEAQRARLRAAQEAQDDLEAKICQSQIGLAALSPSLRGLLTSQQQLVGEFLRAVRADCASSPSRVFEALHGCIAKATEAERTLETSPNIRGFTRLEEKLADILIMTLSLADTKHLRLADAFDAKMRYNFTRPPSPGQRID